MDETIGFADDEDPSDGLVSDRRDEGMYLEDSEKDSAVMAEGLPKVSCKCQSASEATSASHLSCSFFML